MRSPCPRSVRCTANESPVRFLTAGLQSQERITKPETYAAATMWRCYVMEEQKKKAQSRDALRTAAINKGSVNRTISPRMRREINTRGIDVTDGTVEKNGERKEGGIPRGRADFNRASSRDNEFMIRHGCLATRFKAVRRTKRYGN